MDIRGTGYWWLSHKSEHRFKGEYTNDGNGISLKIEREYDPQIPQLSLGSSIKHIYGEINEGKSVTLLNCSVIFSSLKANGEHTVIIKSDHIIIGDHINSIDTYTSKKGRISFDKLQHWLGTNPFTINQTGIDILARYTYPEEIKINIKYLRSDISFLHRCTAKLTMGDNIQMKSTPYIEITPHSPKNIQWYISAGNNLNKYLSLLSGYAHSCDSLSIENSSRNIDQIHKAPFLDIYSSSTLNNAFASEREASVTFIRKNNIEPILGDTINTWFNIHDKFINTIDLFYEAIQHKTLPRWEFLNLIFAAENLYKVLYKKI